MSTLSTHVLDAALGVPAAGVVVVLSGPAADETGTTDDDGRLRFPAELVDGAWTLTFATGTWFAGAGRDHFHSQVSVGFEVGPRDSGARPHLHVALLLSPYAYTTYLGS